MSGPGSAAWPGPADPGLQPERTDLSWNRTAMAYALASAVLLRWAGVLGAGVFVLVLMLFGVALLIHLTQRSRYHRHVEGVREGRASANVRGVLIMSGSMISYGVVALVLVLHTPL